MRTLLIPAAAAAMLLTAPLAFAAGHGDRMGDDEHNLGTQITTSVVTRFDLKAQTLTLADGKTYTIIPGEQLPALKAGEKVQVAWDVQNGERVADYVKLMQ